MELIKEEFEKAFAEAIPYKSPYQGTSKLSIKDGKLYSKDFYNFKDLPTFDEDSISDAAWYSIHDYFATAVSGTDDIIGIPFWQETYEFNPHTLLTKSLKRPKLYVIHGKLQCICPRSCDLDTWISRTELKESFEFEKKGLTGFGWNDPKGAALVKMKCDSVKLNTISDIPENTFEVQLRYLGSMDREVLMREHVVDRLFVVDHVITAANLVMEVTIGTVDYIFHPEKHPDQEPFMHFTDPCPEFVKGFGMPVAFKFQKIFLDPENSAKKAMRKGEKPQSLRLIKEMQPRKCAKYKENGLWAPYVGFGPIRFFAEIHEEDRAESDGGLKRVRVADG